MGDLLVERLKSAIGSNSVLYLLNGFRFECKIISIDDQFLEIYDTKKRFTKLIRINEVREVDL